MCYSLKVEYFSSMLADHLFFRVAVDLSSALRRVAMNMSVRKLAHGI